MEENYSKKEKHLTGEKHPGGEQRKTAISVDEMDPTFLFIWKGTRKKDEGAKESHTHDHLEIAFVLSGMGRYCIDGEIYPIEEGDLLIINPKVPHQVLACPEASTPATEFFVGFSDIRITGCKDNFFPLPDGKCVIPTAGELRQRLFKICSSMEAENAVRRQGRYFMLKSYLV